MLSAGWRGIFDLIAPSFMRQVLLLLTVNKVDLYQEDIRIYLSLRSVRVHLGFSASALLLTFSRTAWSHNGALDAQGGHYHHSDQYGGYHFHEGLLAGQSFLSPELANAAFESAFKAAAADPDREVPLDDRALSDFFRSGNPVIKLLTTGILPFLQRRKCHGAVSRHVV